MLVRRFYVGTAQLEPVDVVIPRGKEIEEIFPSEREKLKDRYSLKHGACALNDFCRDWKRASWHHQVRNDGKREKSSE